MSGLLRGRRKPHRMLGLLGLALVLVLAVAESGEARKRARISAEDVARLWIGASEDGLFLLRLELEADGRGRGAFVFLDREPETFGIASWKYAEGRVELSLGSSDIKWQSPVHGRFVGTEMHLEVRGPDWKQKYVMHHEEPLVRRWRALKEAM